MAKAGDRIENPVAGERIIFRQTAQETGGTLLQFDDLLRVGGFGPPEHVHPHQEERFHVVAGTMGLRVGDREQTLHPGESLTVPPGVPHTWWNAGTEELHQLAEFRPALNLETFFETLFGLARDGKCDQEGQPTFMQIAAMVPVYHIYLSKPPILLQKALFAVLGPVARLRGYRAQYPQYTTSAPTPIQS